MLLRCAIAGLASVGCGGPEPTPTDEFKPAPPTESSGPARGDPAWGRIEAWPEAATHLHFDLTERGANVALGPARSTGLDAFWSVASTNPGRGYFYGDIFFGDRQETRVARRAGVTHVGEIRDAATLDYSERNVGPVSAGEVVVFHHVPTRSYLALKVERIYPAPSVRNAGPGPYAFADITWYFHPSGDFSGF